MNRTYFAMTALMCSILWGCAMKTVPEQKPRVHNSGFSMPATKENVVLIIKDWPKSSNTAAQQTLDAYGIPDIVSDSQLIWYNSGPFKRTVVFRDPVPHAFPIPHEDVLQQTIDYRVPRSMVDRLVELDGSLVVDRTKGELSARNQKEAMNFLALNLADKVVRRELSVQQARVEYLNSAKSYLSGTSNRYLTKLNFKTEGSTADPDQIADPGQVSIQAQEAVQEAAREATKEIQESQMQP